MEKGKKELWFVIDVESEESYSTVPQEDVIYDEPINVGDEVCFFWNKEEFTGIIRFMNEHKKTCLEEAKRLNALRRLKAKKEASFHEERPRKSALKFLSKLGKCQPAAVTQGKAKMSKKCPQPNKKNKMEDVTAKRLLKNARKEAETSETEDADIDRETDISTEEVESSSDEDRLGSSSKAENSNIALKLATQLASKFDTKMLSQLVAVKNAEELVKFLPKQDELPVKQNQESTSEAQRPESTDEAQRPSASSAAQAPESIEAPQSSHYKKKIRPVFGGSMFNADCDNGVELLNSKVYCVKRWHNKASNGNSAGIAARNLLMGVFTEEALLSCTVSGLPPRGKGKDAYASNPSLIKPVLCPDAVDAIVEQCLQWQREKHWKPKRDQVYLRSVMSVRLCEFRDQHKKQM